MKTCAHLLNFSWFSPQFLAVHRFHQNQIRLSRNHKEDTLYYRYMGWILHNRRTLPAARQSIKPCVSIALADEEDVRRPHRMRAEPLNHYQCLVACAVRAVVGRYLFVPVPNAAQLMETERLELSFKMAIILRTTHYYFYYFY